MGKRYTDTDKWKKRWFRTLKPIHKCFWQYLCDNCNHAGIWDVDFDLASFIIGAPLDVDQVKKTLQKQYTELNHGKKWLIRDFITFQYGDLNPQNRVHASVIVILKKEGAYKPLTRGLQGAKDKDKDKDKDIKGGAGGEEKWVASAFQFERIWSKYPKPLGKKEAFKCFKASVKTLKDLTEIQKALDNYLNSKDVKKGFVQHGKTWFRNWGDWCSYKDPLCTKCKGSGRFSHPITGFDSPCDCPAGVRRQSEGAYK